ncbi:hypothetical protein K505DRAFT_329477 [Melanomma pulvis-pyrius CBS 109.77]|uniref:Uncharacterized protein n=1 Tax=Melanomma pulvis-pyrius CBS 109.77 TaxID=1314802 RepID=A0A6A6WUT3_9PLEO|nr:hypothetical protein K505DRAFT_329477 [Melanomma pulvis-pyrius CBS 109.77]
MDDTLILAICTIPLYLLFPCLAVFLIIAIPAYTRTKKWDKARKQNATELEANTLISPDDESDSLDTDDETEDNERKTEEENDKYLTFRQKWLKEMKKGWKGEVAKQAQNDEEREERRKLARAVARELDRRERRRAMRSESEAQDAEALPPYRKAMGV